MKLFRIVYFLIFSLIPFLISLSGCLTLNVNVNFPESAVQAATDSYVKDLYRQKEKGKPAKTIPSLEPETETPPQKPHTMLAPNAPQTFYDLSLFNVAWAETPQFHIDSAKAMKIREKQAGLLSEIISQKKDGVLGETNDGKLVIKSPEKLKKLLVKKVENLVAQENSLRTELYQEVVESNHLAANHLVHVKQSFARSFEAESPAGTWVQDPSGSWTQKK